MKTTTAATTTTTPTPADARAERLRGWRPWLVLAGLALALGVVNVGIGQRERVLRDGRVLLLELAPVDPRSLMQGDYMRLRFAAADPIRRALDGTCTQVDAARAPGDCMDGFDVRRMADAYAVFTVGEDGTGRVLRVQATARPAAPGEVVVRVRLRGWEGVRIASNAWFFAEGEAARWEPARYGELRVGPDGTALLTGLRDAQRKPL